MSDNEALNISKLTVELYEQGLSYTDALVKSKELYKKKGKDDLND